MQETGNPPLTRAAIEAHVSLAVFAAAKELNPDFNFDTLNAASSIADDLGLDSLSKIELGVLTERAIGVVAGDKELWEAQTVGDIIRVYSDALQIKNGISNGAQ